MNNSAVKKFAIRARKLLITDIEKTVNKFGIRKHEIKQPEVNDFNKEDKLTQRSELVSLIRKKGYQSVLEEVAYNWFIRLVALRFMEVNQYIPDGISVMLSENIDREASKVILEDEHVDQYSDSREQMYKRFLIKQCNLLHELLPDVFEEMTDCMKLLAPNELIGEGSIIHLLTTLIKEEDWISNIEIVGWLYQYYFLEKKDEVFTELKKNHKIAKENIPVATQLFTPKWIVQYMVENSLGRLWIENNPNEKLKTNWSYYLENDEQEKTVVNKLKRLSNKEIKPEQIKVIDPCMGTGHILVYAFDVLYQIYEAAGYCPNEIPALIIENNLFGLDIDDRVAQLSHFALIMKARAYNKKIFQRKLNINVYPIQETPEFSEEFINFFVQNNQELRSQFELLLSRFENGKELGSIIETNDINIFLLKKRARQLTEHAASNLFETNCIRVIKDKVMPMIAQAKILKDKYDVVITNPPYMGNRGMSKSLSHFVKEHYPRTKSDLFAVMMERMQKMVAPNRFVVNVTMQSWMFLSSFEIFRKKLLEQLSITTLMHMDHMVLGIAFGTVATVFRSKIDDFRGTFQYVKMSDIENGQPIQFPVTLHRYTKLSSNQFADIPGSPIAYWMTEETREIFKKQPKLEEVIDITGSQHKTANNEKYIRYHWEVSRNQLGDTWVTYAKGGKYRKWYGNNELVLDWSKEAQSFYKTNKNSNTLQERYRFRKGISWTATTNGNFSCRVLESTGLFDMKGPALFVLDQKNFYYMLGLLNSKPINYFLNMFSETSDYQNIDVKRLPYIDIPGEMHALITNKVKENIQIAMFDWDTQEKSINFLRPSLLRLDNRSSCLKQCYHQWESFSSEQVELLKKNEQQINRIFIRKYSLQNELHEKMDSQEITLHKANKQKEIKAFISYAVGCMFGRYSLDSPGVVFAGGDFREQQYHTFKPTNENIIPITDKEYFNTDIISLFIEFVKVSYGERNLESNLNFIAEALNKKVTESSRQAIRRYFLKGFYKDHIQNFQKRPIYWLFDSGKKGGFKALMYVHRYTEGLVEQLRTNYLQPLMQKYVLELEHLRLLSETNIPIQEKKGANKQIVTIQQKLLECRKYDQVISIVAHKQINLNINAGVKNNYAILQNIDLPKNERGNRNGQVLSPIKL